jgi:hypothetical protein
MRSRSWHAALTRKIKQWPKDNPGAATHHEHEGGEPRPLLLLMLLPLLLPPMMIIISGIANGMLLLV